MKGFCLVLSSVFMLSVLVVAKDMKSYPAKNASIVNRDKLLPNEAFLGPTADQIRQLRELSRKKEPIDRNKSFYSTNLKGAGDWELVPLNSKTRVAKSDQMKGYDDFYIYYFRDFVGQFIFREYDSLGVWFRPKYPCKIKEVQVLFCQESDLLGQDVEICIYDVPDTLIPTNEYQTACPGNGIYDFIYYKEILPSPQGEVYGKYPMIVTSYGYEDTDWNILDLADYDGPIDVGTRDFFVAFQFPAGNDDSADVYYGPSDELHYWGDFHSFKWYADGGTYSPGVPNWVVRLNFSIRVKVEYKVPPRPVFTFVESIKRRIYDSCNPGPYTITAGLYHDEYLTEQLSSVKLIYYTDDIADADTIDITGSQQPGADENTNIYSGEIPSHSIGTTIWYYLYAEYTDSTNRGYIIKTSPVYFEISEVSPGTTILIIKDGQSADIDRYMDVLNYNGWKYDFWDTDKNGSPGLCELQHYTSLFWLQGQGTGGYLNADSLDLFVLPEYLDAGGNLFLVSADYIGTAHDNDYDGTWKTATHSFVFDYLKVAEYCSDANADTDGNSADSLYKGIGGNAISGFLGDDTLLTMPKTKYYEFNRFYSSWADEVVPATSADSPFLVYSESAGDWVTASTMVDGDYKMVFLPWYLESAEDQNKFEQIVKNVLMFFNEKAAPRVSIESGPRYVVAANSGPYNVTASFVEGDGTVAGVQLGLSLDGINFTYTDVVNENGVCHAIIPDIEIGDTLYYHIRAEDNDGLFGFSETYRIIKIDFTPSRQLLYCGDDPYDWYYRSSVDSVVVSSLKRIDVHYDYYDVDQYGPPSHIGLLDHYSSVIWHGYADWDESFPYATEDNPFMPFIEAGGNLLFSSEEMLGTLLGWDGYVSTHPGQAVYDVLGVSWYAPDMAYDTIRVYPGSENEDLVSGMDTKIVLNELPFGYFGDIIDPINFDNVVPIMDAWVPAWGCWYGDWACYTVWMEDSTFKRIVLPFSLASLDDHNRDIFLENVIDFFGIVNAVEEPVETLPKAFALKQNFPNPFNPITSINFEMPTAQNVRLTVYNMLGQSVRTLVNDQRSAGLYTILWDGRDDAGHMVGSGVYFYQIQAGSFTKTAKMVFLK